MQTNRLFVTRSAQLLAAALLLFALSTLAGWQGQIAFLLDDSGKLPLMSLSSAWIFLLGGIVLMVTSVEPDGPVLPSRWQHSANVCALAMGLLAIARLLMLAFMPASDQAEDLSTLLVGLSARGRHLKAVASLGFLLWSASYLLYYAGARATPGSLRRFSGDVALMAYLLLAAVGLVAAVVGVRKLGTATAYPSATLWIAAAHMVLAVGLALLRLPSTSPRWPKPSLRDWAKIAVAVQLNLTLFGWVALSHSEQEHVTQRIGSQIHGLERAFVDGMQTRTRALERMGRRWEAAGGTPPALWSSDVEVHLRTLPGFQAIAYARANGQVARIEPLAGNEKALGFDLRSEPLRRRALDHSRASGTAVFTAQLDLVQGGKGFLLALPLNVNGRFDGWLCAVFRSQDFFAELSRPIGSFQFSVEVLSAGQIVYRNPEEGNLEFTRLAHTFVIPNGDGEWVIRLIPSQEAVSAYESTGPTILLVFGAAMTLLLAMVFWLMGRGADQKDQLQVAQQFSQAMEHESVRLALVSKYVLNPIAITDRSGRCLWANQAFCQTTGLTLGQVSERDFCDLLQAQVIETDVVQQFRSAFAAGSRLKMEVSRPLADGSTQWATVEVSPAPDADGELHQFIVIATDITETKRVQLELAASQRFLRELLNVIPGMVGYWDNALRCRFANSAYLDWFGRTTEQMQGIAIQELLGPVLFSQNETYIRAALRGESSDFERTLSKPDGSTGYTWAHYVPDVYLGQVRGFFVLVSDITEIKKAQLQLVELNSEMAARTLEAESATRAKSAFLSSMSHELRTPMNAMLGFAQLIGMDSTIADHHKDNVAEVLQAGKHLLGLINDLLSLSKIESGQTTVKLANIVATELAQECLALVRPMATDQNIQLDADIAPLTFKSDRRLLKQVLINLLSNAIKYNRPQGRVSLTIGADATGQIALTVTDRGIGIARNRQPELFQYFNRLGAERSAVDGHGIGLAVSYQLVQLLGGHIAVSSEEGVGSTFCIQLPADLPNPVEEGGLGEQSKPPPEPIPAATILNVDDSAPNRRLVKGILANYPHLTLLEATTGEMALEMARRHRPNLILMDIQLSGMDGIETLRRLRELPETKDIAVIAISANVLHDQAERVQYAGFDAYLAKPFELDQFIALVQCFLAGSERVHPEA